MRLILSTVAMTIAASALAQTAPTRPPALPTPKIAATPATMALARQIAKLLNSDDITRIQLDKAITETMPKALLADPDIAALESKYPGVVSYMLTQARPVMEQNANQRGPELINRLALVYASEMNENELQLALDFYRGATGMWLIDKIAHGMDFSAMMGKVIDNPDVKVSGSDFGSAINSAVPGLAAGMTAQRQKDLMAFVLSPTGRKVRALNPRLLEVAAIWTNGPDPEYDKALEAAMSKAVSDYIAQHGGPRIDAKPSA